MGRFIRKFWDVLRRGDMVLLLLCVVLVPIERALKRNFDENGNPLGNVEV